MKRALAWILPILLAWSMAIPALADAPSNAELLREYEELIQGTWEYSSFNASGTVTFADGEMKDNGSTVRYMLLIDSADTVYFVTIMGSAPNEPSEIAFSSDGEYILFLNEDGWFGRALLHRQEDGVPPPASRGDGR